MSDLISRQAAANIAADLQIHNEDFALYNQAVNNYCAELMKLPSAQPEIIKCRDCKHYISGSDDVRYCFNHDDDILWKDDDFCSRAERREE